MTSKTRIIRSLWDKKDIRSLCQLLFPNVKAVQELKPTQIRLIKIICLKEHRRVVISAYTRYGKSQAVAIGVALYILFYENKKINLIGATDKQAEIIKGYISTLVLDCYLLADMLDLVATGIDRIKKEVSRTKWTFKNDMVLQVFSAQGDAKGLMGFGADVTIIDESGQIKKDTYTQKISRMTLDSPDSTIIEIGNPWRNDDHFAAHMKDPKWLHIHIGWELGVKEGRHTLEQIQEKQEELATDPIGWRVLYEALPPEENEDQLIRSRYIDEAIGKSFRNVIFTKIKHGLDVAEFGRDESVLATANWSDTNMWQVTRMMPWKKMDVMESADKVADLIQKEQPVNVDANGVGAGVWARLKQLGFIANDIKVGRAPEGRNDRETEEKKNKFLNQKAEFYWNLKVIFEQGRISIPNDPVLIAQLKRIRYKRSDNTQKIQIVDKEDDTVESPDRAESLMLLCAPSNVKKLVFGFA